MNEKLKTQPLDGLQIAFLSLIQSEAEDLAEEIGTKPQLKRIIEASQKLFDGAGAGMIGLTSATRMVVAELPAQELADRLNRVLIGKV